MPAALLFAADPAGSLRVVAGVGAWGGDPHAVQDLAETLGGGVDVLDVTGAIEGARFAAGARLGDGEGALLVLAPDDRTPGPEWDRAFAASAQVALGLVRAAPGGADRARLLHEVAVHPGAFEDRLALALQRAAEATGLDAAAFALTEGGQWRVQAGYDPSGRLVPTRPVPLAQTFCAVTTRTDGPFAVEDAVESGGPVEAPAAYLGAPVFVGGRCVGTFSVVGAVPRARPFSDGDRALVESLARWVGATVQGRTTARLLADREADLAAFFDAAPMGMGVARLLEGDLEFVRVNAAAAAALGAEPEALAGRRASEVGLGGRLGQRWLAACRRALAEGEATRFETLVERPRGPRTFATTVSLIDADGPGGARFTFVVDDVTRRRRAAAAAHEREAQIEALVAHAPVALFAADAEGRLEAARGRALDLLGLDGAEGEPLAALLPDAGAPVEAALGGGEGTWTLEAQGRAFEVRLVARLRDGRPAGLLGVALDVTEREGGARAAEAAASARRALLKHLDHEIRSPLTSILGYADLLGEETPPDEVVEVRDVIARAGERLLAALDELTLLGDEEVTAHPVPTDACDVVAAVAEASLPAAEARRIALNVWCTLPEGPILLDPALFERIVRHLVSGAVATATVARVDVRLMVDGPDGLLLSVTGGVPDDALGLGVSYVPRLAEALGGSARIVPGPRPGWVVRLPRRAVPVVQLEDAVEALGADGAAGEAPAMALSGDGA